MCRVIRLTPPGRGAVATLRIEGPRATAIVQSQFRARSGRPLAVLAADQLAVGCFGGEQGEEVVVRRSADDAVEVHCHGGFAAVAKIEELLTAAGCRAIAWRDWAAETNDPIRASALLALADARTTRTAAILLDQYHGALDRALAEIRQAKAAGRHDEAQRQIDALLARVPLGQHLVKPWRVVLAGRVNVGKSSLMNSLAGFGRSIVHPTPGTTRDAVTLSTVIDGWPIELCDTAGLRSGADAIEQAGIALAQERIAGADLTILVFDGSQSWSADDQALCDRWPQAIVVHNKSDAAAVRDDRPAGLWLSALHGDGVEALLSTIANRLVPAPPPPGSAVPLTTEQVEAVLAV